MSTKGPDAGLRRELRTHIKNWQWTHVESPTTSPGVPDTEFCAPGGVQGWVECKRTPAWAVTFRPLQVSFLERRARLGGRAFVAVRRLTKRGDDELWIYAGRSVRDVATRGLRADGCLGLWAGGPANWDWVEVGEILAGRTR